MRNVVRCVVGFVVIATCGCVVKVNGQVRKFGLDGEEKVSAEEAAKMGGVPANPDGGGGAAGGASDTDALAAELSGAAQPSGQSVAVKATFSPNPTVVGTYATKADVNIREAPHGVSNCSGYVGAEPAVVLNLESAMKDTRISAPGAQLILAEFGDRKYVCKDGGYGGGTPPSVLLDPEWPAGEIRIYVGGRKGETYRHEVRIEDEKRPIDILWKNKVKTVDLAEVPKEPLILSETTPNTPGAKSRCGNGFFREAPDVAFQPKRPLGEMTIEVRSAQPIDVQLIGPLTEDGRKIPSNCMNDDRMFWNRWEAGLYGLRVGTPSSGAEVLYHIVVRGKDTPRNPTAAPAKWVTDATVEESVLTYHYPQLTQGDLDTNNANREAIFLSAPKQLFVFPKFSMDKSVAEVIGGGGRSSDPKAPAPEYPKENEPLLLMNRNGWVMAADGSVFRVNMKDLQADAGGAVVIPAAPRNTALSFDQALRQKGPEDAKAVAAYEKAQRDVDSCYDRARRSYEVSYENACVGYERALAKKKEALEKELTKNRIARRTASLAKIKTRLETVFKG